MKSKFRITGLTGIFSICLIVFTLSISGSQVQSAWATDTNPCVGDDCPSDTIPDPDLSVQPGDIDLMTTLSLFWSSIF